LAGTVAGAITGYFGAVAALCSTRRLQALRAIPSIAWVPLFILWLGISILQDHADPVGVFFPVYLGVMGAVMSVDRKIVEVGRVFRLSGTQMVRRILLPAVLPAYVIALRSGLGLGWMFVVAARTARRLGGARLSAGRRPAARQAGADRRRHRGVRGHRQDHGLAAQPRDAPFLRWEDRYGGSSVMLTISHSRKDLRQHWCARSTASRSSVAPGEICRGGRCARAAQVHAAAPRHRARHPSQGTVALDGDSDPRRRTRRSASCSRSRACCPGSPSRQCRLRLADRPKAERAERVARQLDRVGLTDKANVWPRELSGGQAQRVALARAGDAARGAAARRAVLGARCVHPRRPAGPPARPVGRRPSRRSSSSRTTSTRRSCWPTASW
jgi:ABC-type dipeptide/oligopeptide/nickel transport system ATPase component